MSVFKCKMCGGTLEIQSGESIAVCDSCGTKQTLPRLNDNKKTNLYDRANHYRRNNDFDKAMGIYEQILNEDSTDAEAYWSIVLCRYGIEYVEDPKSHKRVPTINRTQLTSIFADEDYKLALQYADGYQKAIYEEEAKAIYQLQKNILTISKQEEPFDIFICYKETDSDGKRTNDSVLANELYYQLIQEGFKVFFSRITLEDKLGTAYEPYIFAALNSSKVMIVVGSKPEYFNAVWVKNEWSRYLKLIKSGAKKMLIPAYKDMDPYDLPEEFSHLQAQDMSKLGFMQDLIRGIKKILASDEPNIVKKETVIMQQETGGATITALIDRGHMALEDKEWEKANEYFDKALNIDAHCGEAYLGRVLATNKTSTIKDFFTARLDLYIEAYESKSICCVEETELINNMIREYTIPNYFESDKIKAIYKFDRRYSTTINCRKEQYKTEERYLKSDSLINRALQFLSGSKKKEFEDTINAILTTLLEWQKNAESDAEEARNNKSAEYKKHLAEATLKVKKFYEKASQIRENNYLASCKKFEKSQTIEEYKKLAEEFELYGYYKDAMKREMDCHNKIDEIIAAKEEAVIKNRKKVTLLICIAFIVVIIFLSVLDIMKNNEVRQKIIGKSFSGTYRYQYSYNYNSYNYKNVQVISIKIVDENYCNISVVEEKTTNGKRETEIRDYDNAPYFLNGGLFGTRFNWKSGEVMNSTEAFEVEIKDNEIILYTPNYSMGEPLRLSGK